MIPIRLLIGTHGYASAFFWFGLGQGLIVLAVSWMLRGPGGWDAVSLVAAVANIVVALLALFVLRPMRHRALAVAPSAVPRQT